MTELVTHGMTNTNSEITSHYIITSLYGSFMIYYSIIFIIWITGSMLIILYVSESIERSRDIKVIENHDYDEMNRISIPIIFWPFGFIYFILSVFYNYFQSVVEGIVLKIREFGMRRDEAPEFDPITYRDSPR